MDLRDPAERLAAALHLGAQQPAVERLRHEFEELTRQSRQRFEDAAQREDIHRGTFVRMPAWGLRGSAEHQRETLLLARTAIRIQQETAANLKETKAMQPMP